MLTALACLTHAGDRTLFGADEQKREPRGTFFGYVAVSKPKQSAGVPSNEPTEVVSNNSAAAADGDAAEEHPQGEGLDVALVWRGTIFKEEWESNFCENQLVRHTETIRVGATQAHSGRAVTGVVPIGI